MPRIQEPLRTVLRDFRHVEWYEVDELAQWVQGGTASFNLVALDEQLAELLAASAELPVGEIDDPTANEFESADEAKVWLSSVPALVFQHSP